MPASRSSASTKRTYRRRRITIAVAVVIVLAIGIYLPLTLLAPLKAAASTTTAYPAITTVAQKLPMPSYGASGISAVGYPGLLASGGTKKPMPMASISKIITSLIVLQKDPLTPTTSGPTITFTEQDEVYSRMYAAEDGDTYPIQVGAKMTERDVMTTALVYSANNYARALVDWAFGSQAKFVPVARAWLKAHGMTSTTMVEPTGINPMNASTPSDLMILGQLALDNPVISGIVSTRKITLPVVGTISNTNLLLGDDGIDGIKTGTLIPQGCSLLFSSRFVVGSTTITLIGVILDGPSHPVIDAQIKKIVTAAMKGFQVVQLAKSGQSFGTYTTLWGTTVSAVASKSVSVIIWKGTPVSEATAIRSVTIARKDTPVGAATFTVTGQTLTVPLKLSGTISDPGVAWRLTHPRQLL